MSSKKNRKTKTRNRLWVARKRVGIGQKQLARMLNHKTPDQISRYERGLQVPTLRTALELEIALRTPLRMLFPDLYRQLREEMAEKTKRSSQMPGLSSEALLNEEFEECCTYTELIKKPHPTEDDKSKAYTHVRHLAYKLAYLG